VRIRSHSQSWEAKLGTATLEGDALHLRVSMEAAEVQQKFGEILASPFGQGLGALVEAARYLPVRENTAPKQARPIIYGLDGGPREVIHYSDR
jgi:hypothetical protein